MRDRSTEARECVTRRQVSVLLERVSALRSQLYVYLRDGVDDRGRQLRALCRSSGEARRLARQRADLIYNRYYTQGGICDALETMERFALEEMEDIPCDQEIKDAVQGNCVRVLLFTVDRLHGALRELDAQTAAISPVDGSLTEEMLEPLGWAPVGGRIEALHGRLLRMRASDEALADCTPEDWRLMTVQAEECAGLLSRNRARMQAAEGCTVQAGVEEEILRAVEALLDSAPFRVLRDAGARAEDIPRCAEEFASLARGMIDRFERNKEYTDE